MIEVQNLTKFYGPIPAVADISFRVDQGEVVGFLGPNGAGKTTTLKMLTCFLPPTSGWARVNGFDIQADSLQVRSRIGYLPENVPLYPEMTVNGFLTFAARAKGISPKVIRDSVNETVASCGLDPVRERIIGHLSKGFRQRVGLAQALLNNPPVLILDEPTIGLDPAQVIEIRQLIKGLGRERTIILSSHILPEVSQLCQRVIILNKGRIVARDTVSNLTAQLQTSRMVHLTVEGPREEVLRALAAQPGVLRAEALEEGAGKYTLEMNKDQDVRAQVAKMIIDRDWGLLEMASQELSLEEIFVQLVTEETEGAV